MSDYIKSRPEMITIEGSSIPVLPIVTMVPRCVMTLPPVVAVAGLTSNLQTCDKRSTSSVGSIPSEDLSMPTQGSEQSMSNTEYGSSDSAANDITNPPGSVVEVSTYLQIVKLCK